MNQYTEDPLLYTYSGETNKLGRLVRWRDRIIGGMVITALLVGLWLLVFHDWNSYVFTEDNVRAVLRPDDVEVFDGYTVFSKISKAPVTIVLRNGADEKELSVLRERIRERMALATQALAEEFPSEDVRGSEFEFHNLNIFCAFAQNCGSYEQRLLSEVQRLNLVDRSDAHFVPGGD